MLLYACPLGHLSLPAIEAGLGLSRPVYSRFLNRPALPVGSVPDFKPSFGMQCNTTLRNLMTPNFFGFSVTYNLVAASLPYTSCRVKFGVLGSRAQKSQDHAWLENDITYQQQGAMIFLPARVQNLMSLVPMTIPAGCSTLNT